MSARTIASERHRQKGLVCNLDIRVLLCFDLGGCWKLIVESLLVAFKLVIAAKYRPLSPRLFPLSLKFNLTLS